jgi:hypothetical protein
MYPDEFQVLNVLSSAGASILGLGLPDADDLPGLVAQVRRSGRRNPWGAKGLEWETPSPPPTENFLEDGALVTPEAYEYTPSDSQAKLPATAAHGRGLSDARHDHAHHPALAHHFRRSRTAEGSSGTLGMWAFLLTEVLFFGGLFIAYRLPLWYPEAFARGAQLDRDHARRHQHRRADRQLADDGAVGARGPDQSGQGHGDHLAHRHLILGSAFLGIKVLRVQATSGAPPVPGPNVPVPRTARRRWTKGAGRAGHEVNPTSSRTTLSSSPLLRDDRPARAPHDHRARSSWSS